MTMLNRAAGIAFLVILLGGQGWAQDSLAPKTAFVTVAPVPLASMIRGRETTVDVQFRVRPGLHINSNTPGSKVLIPTRLQLDPPTDVLIGRITYPVPQQMSFAFAPDDQLSVYTGDFTVSVAVRPLVHMTAGKYAVHGRLKYQACDNSACYPPKLLPVTFDIKVLKNPVAPRKNPAQSPHAHR
ncbi:MAG TPA: protein-disulfide reductase DsbD domain-containing protein [Terriglobales bacterium]|nr:protein-disulfide reductase DsbD domain-containing protein [Terriglobales bacterium]